MLAAAESNARRERELAAQHVSSDRERELAEAQAASEQAALDAARQRLESLGFRAGDFDKRATAPAAASRSARRSTASSSRARSRSARRCKRATDAFRVADLTHLWVNLDVYEKDLEAVHVDQRVDVTTESLPGRVLLGARRLRRAARRRQDAHRARAHRDGQPGRRAAPGAVRLGAPARRSQARRWRRCWRCRAAPSSPSTASTSCSCAAPTGGSSSAPVELGASGGDLRRDRARRRRGRLVVTDGAFLLKSELLR